MGPFRCHPVATHRGCDHTNSAPCGHDTQASSLSLVFAYADHVGTTSRRQVEPFRLVSAGRRWYLLAFDLDRDDWRVFRVDRIAEAFATGARFAEREPVEDPATFVTDKMYSSAPTYEAAGSFSCARHGSWWLPSPLASLSPPSRPSRSMRRLMHCSRFCLG